MLPPEFLQWNKYFSLAAQVIFVGLKGQRGCGKISMQYKCGFTQKGIGKLLSNFSVHLYVQL